MGATKGMNKTNPKSHGGTTNMEGVITMTHSRTKGVSNAIPRPNQRQIRLSGIHLLAISSEMKTNNRAAYAIHANIRMFRTGMRLY